MAQEFTINSSAIESKINQLLPSQGGSGAGIDFSASTMVIPIVDLTESAEGSSLRIDLQTALSHNNMTSFSVTNATSAVINTTGFFRIFGQISINGTSTGTMKINDGASDKVIMKYIGFSDSKLVEPYDFIIKMDAGDTFSIVSASTSCVFDGTSRQIATIDGNLV